MKSGFSTPLNITFKDKGEFLVVNKKKMLCPFQRASIKEIAKKKKTSCSPALRILMKY